MLKQEIIKQYIATLKEDNELDYIFPLLLKQMGYRILLTPKQSKGQPQYGRDVVAAKNVDGVDTLFLFELKGFSAKDITDRTLSARDGIIESLNASKNTKYRDASILGLSNVRGNMSLYIMVMQKRMHSSPLMIMWKRIFQKGVLTDGIWTN